jgi:tol-pal system protein YbgF
VRQQLLTVLAAITLSGCALKGDVRRVETQLTEFREEVARADSARAVMLAERLEEIVTLQSRAADSLGRLVLSLRGQMRGDLTEVHRQLVAIQELTGQSQARLTELRGQIQRRSVESVAPATQGGGQAPGEGPEDLYEIGIQQHRRGSPQTARAAFQRLLQDFPQHPRAADAQFFIGETFGPEQPDSAEAAYESVLADHPDSPRAPAALYRIARMYEQRGDIQAARLHYRRIVVGYPRSEEAELARTKLRNP